MIWALFRRLVVALVVVVGGVLGLALLYKIVPVPVTPLMVIRLVQGHPMHRTWVPWKQIPAALPASVVAAEDGLFCQHNGFDFEAISKAMESESGHGASTVSQQTAKNVFLWPAHSWVRKGLEVPLTVMIEALWGKQRIMEIYLNVVEFGPGIYGIGAAAKQRFGTTPRNLSKRQIALLVAVLPSPLHWSPTHPGPYVAQRGGIIRRRTVQLGPKDGPYLGCLYP